MFCDYEGHGFATDYAMSVESAKFYRVYYKTCISGSSALCRRPLLASRCGTKGE